MKLLTFSLAALASLGMLSACSSDDPALAGGDGSVSFTVQLPADMATRAAVNSGNGLTATSLTAAVYSVDAQGAGTLVAQQPATFSNLQANVKFDLIKGASYKVVFFAQAPTGSPYNFNVTDAKVTVDYSNMTYTEANDCFYKAIDVTVSPSYTGESVTLYRPVAQLNLGTDDLRTAGMSTVFPTDGIPTVKTEVQGLANELNVLTGVASATSSFSGTATTTAKMADYANFNFPVDGFDYLAMGYYLLPGQVNNAAATAAKSDHKCSFTFMNGSTPVGDAISDDFVPMRPNYRTNIYGALLTTGVVYDVTIDPAFAGAWNNGYPVLTWDGTSACPPQNQFDFANHTIDIKTPAEFAWFRDQINAMQVVSVYGQEINPTFLGYQVNLECSIDLNELAWTPIGLSRAQGSVNPGWRGVSTPNAAQYSEPASNAKWGKGTFSGEFNGNGCTISNLKINNPTKDYVGLFGYVYGLEENYNKTSYRSGYIHDLTVENANVTGQQFVSALLADGYQWAYIKNCTISNCTLAGNAYVGGLVGYIYGNAIDNTAINCNITVSPYIPAGETEYDGGDKGGALIGFVGEGSTSWQGRFTGNTVTGGTVKGYRDCGGMLGLLQFQNTFENNHVSGVTMSVVNVPAGGVYAGASKPGKAPGDFFGAIVGRALNTAQQAVGISASNTSTNVTLP